MSDIIDELIKEKENNKDWKDWTEELIKDEKNTVYLKKVENEEPKKEKQKFFNKGFWLFQIIYFSIAVFKEFDSTHNPVWFILSFVMLLVGCKMFFVSD